MLGPKIHNSFQRNVNDPVLLSKYNLQLSNEVKPNVLWEKPTIRKSFDLARGNGVNKQTNLSAYSSQPQIKEINHETFAKEKAIFEEAR